MSLGTRESGATVAGGFIVMHADDGDQLLASGVKELDWYNSTQFGRFLSESRNAPYFLTHLHGSCYATSLRLASALVLGKHVASPSSRRGPCQNVHGALQCHPASTRSAQGWAPDGPHDRVALLRISYN